MIELKDVTKTYHSGRPNEFTALSEVTLEIEPGRTTLLEGPSGSGKTTLLSIVGCMSRPTAGRLWLEGREITSLPERFLTEIRQRSFGFVFQQFQLIRGITALENTMIPAYPTGEPRARIRERALTLFEQFDLADKAHNRIEWLSGGQAQRVAIIRALINNPKVIIADEPTAHLDTKLAREFMELLGSLVEQGKTLIVSSHDPLVVGSWVVDRVVSMRDGRVGTRA